MKDNETSYYAHSKAGEDLSKWQPLDVHLKNVALLASAFAARFKSEQWAYIAGLWHDIGKYSPKFQDMLRSSSDFDNHTKSILGKVNHSTAGALLATEEFGLSGRLLAYLIAGHHAGLPDWEADETGNAALSIRLKDTDHLASIRDSTIPPEILHKEFPKDKPKSGADPSLWIRMLFSCLVDSDFLDTEKYFDPEKTCMRSIYPRMEDLLIAFNAFMKRKLSSANDTPVNQIRTEILARCKEAAEQESGTYTLTVPTGGGKTLSSMAFALDHAIIHNKERIIYVIPYTSIIEQTADQFREIFGESVVEHHSNFDITEETEEITRMNLACENWDAPIIITTSVQFFESLFSSRTSRSRKLHNIVNSVVILDEAQLLPPEYLNPILFCLDELRRNYGVTLLLTTATQPAFSPQPSFGFTGWRDTKEIIEDPQALHRKLKRVEISTAGSLSEMTSWESLAEALCRYPSVLCIVNRRDDCRTLWKLMPEGTYHLSALMCGAHRSHTIAEIRARLKSGLPTRVISTQLVEAGVDVDFPVVYRALCGLDSIAQAAGRCNREGLMKCGQVVVFRPPSEPPIGYLRRAAGISKLLLEAGGSDPISPERFTQFFEKMYWLEGDRLDKYGILQEIAPDHKFRFAFRTAARKFKLIDDTKQESVVVAYQSGEDLIREMELRMPDWRTMRKIQRYIVNLPRYLHEKLQKEEAIKQIHPSIFVQGHKGLYDEVIGFCPDRSVLYEPDDLII